MIKSAVSPTDDNVHSCSLLRTRTLDFLTLAAFGFASVSASWESALDFFVFFTVVPGMLVVKICGGGVLSSFQLWTHVLGREVPSRRKSRFRWMEQRRASWAIGDATLDCIRKSGDWVDCFQ